MKCARPTVWRLLIQQDPAAYTMQLREFESTGEPPDAEVIAQVEEAWGVTIRDGHDQTGTTAIARRGGSRILPVRRLQHLARVHDAVRVECRLDRVHHVHLDAVLVARQRITLELADPVFGAD